MTIIIPKEKLVDLVKKVYSMSIAVGMGVIHYQEGELTDERAQSLIRIPDNPREGQVVVSMDYVLGRQCKMTVWAGPPQNGEPEPEFYIRNYWPDHSESQFDELLAHLGVSR